MSKTINLAAKRNPLVIEAEVWQDSDGYWIPLVAGYKCSYSDCHTIHELTVQLVLDAMKSIMECDCRECRVPK